MGYFFGGGRITLGLKELNCKLGGGKVRDRERVKITSPLNLICRPSCDNFSIMHVCIFVYMCA